jgi:hypothetical protein
LTLVIGHLGNIDGDFRAKSSTEWAGWWKPGKGWR